MKVAILIPALNEEKYIGELIDSLKSQTYKNKEIIVIDGGSKDRTREIVKQKKATLMTERGTKEERCPSNCWNQASRETNAEVICIFGADFFVTKNDFLDKIMKNFEDRKVAAVSTRGVTKQCTFLEKVITQRDSVDSFSTFIRRDVFLKAGGYPHIGAGEDIVFQKRLDKTIKAMGLTTAIAKDTFFSGHGIHTVGELFEQAKWYGRSSPFYLREFSGRDKVTNFIFVYNKIAYFFFASLFIASLIIPLPLIYMYVSLFFVALYFLITVKKVIEEKDGYKIFRMGTLFIAGLGNLVGVVSYIAGNKRKGR